MKSSIQWSLDSFILGIVRAFPDGAWNSPPRPSPWTATAARRRPRGSANLARLYESHAPGRTDPDTAPVGLPGGHPRQAHFGQETKTLWPPVLNTLIHRLLRLLRQHGEPPWHWGNPTGSGRPPPDGGRAREAPPQRIPGDLPEKLGAAFGPGAPRTEALGKACAALATAARQHAADKPWPELNKTILPATAGGGREKGLPRRYLYYSKLYSHSRPPLAGAALPRSAT